MMNYVDYIKKLNYLYEKLTPQNPKNFTEKEKSRIRELAREAWEKLEKLRKECEKMGIDFDYGITLEDDLLNLMNFDAYINKLLKVD